MSSYKSTDVYGATEIKKRGVTLHYEEGSAAFSEGRAYFDSPYAVNTYEYEEWSDGWHGAYYTYLAEQTYYEWQMEAQQ